MAQLFAKLTRSSTLLVMINLLVKSALILLIAPLGARLLPASAAVTWVLAINLVSLTVLFDLGVSAIISRSVTAALHNAEGLQGRASVLSMARRIYRGLALAFAAVVAGIAVYLLSGRDASSQGLPLALAITFLFGPVYLYFNYRFAYLMGCNQVATVNRVQALSGLVWYALSLGGLYLGYQALSLVLIYAGLIQPAMLFGRLIRDDERASLSAPVSALEQGKILRDVFKAAFGVGMSMIIYNAASYYYANEFRGEPALLGSLVVLQILRGASAFCQSPFYSKIPYMNGLYAKGEREAFFRYGAKRMAIALGMQAVAFVAVFFAFVLPDTRLFSLVPSGSSDAFYVWLSLALVAERLAAMLLQMHTASGHVVWHIVNGCSGSFQIALVYFATGVLGLIVFPVALLAAVVGVQLPIIAYFMRRERRLSAA